VLQAHKKQRELCRCCPSTYLFIGVISMSKQTHTNRFYVYVYLDPRKPGNYVYGITQSDEHIKKRVESRRKTMELKTQLSQISVQSDVLDR